MTKCLWHPRLLLLSWLALWLSLTASGTPAAVPAATGEMPLDSLACSPPDDMRLGTFAEANLYMSANYEIEPNPTPNDWIWNEYLGAPGALDGDDVVRWGPSLGPYHNYSEMTLHLEDLANEFPEYVNLTVIGHSYQGLSIWCARVTAPGDSTTRAGLLVVAHHHAREPITIENALYLLDYLLAYRTETEVANILQSFVVYVIPCLNPDALAMIHLNPWQRKNLRPIDEDHYGGVSDEWEIRDLDGDFFVEYLGDDDYEGIDLDGDGRTGEDFPGGIDLNRNYPVAFEQDSTDPRSETYHGTAPFSEPETQAMRDFVFAQGNTLAFGLTLHSGIAVFLTPWSYTSDASPDEPFFARLGAEVTEASGYEWWSATQLYPSYGTWDDWLYAEYGVPAATLETYGNESAYGIWDYFNPPADRVISVCEQVWQTFVAITRVLLSTPPQPFVAVPAIVPSAVPTTVWVTAADSLSGIKQVCVQFTYDGTNWITLNATHQGGTRYFALVPASIGGGPVTVQARAMDHVGHEVWSNPLTYLTSLTVTIALGASTIVIAFVVPWLVLRRPRAKQ